jgi:hypothetical protein
MVSAENAESRHAGGTISPRRMEAVEELLFRREAELSELETLFANPELYRDGSRTAESVERHRVLKEEIRVLTAEWEQLLVSAEEIGQETR